MRAMNVLLTCAGRRCHLVDAFKQAVAGQGEVYAGDSDVEAPALQNADEAFILPPVTDDGYIDKLITLCDEKRVRLLIPALEPELALLATHRAQFAAIGTLPLVSSPEVVATCYDKLRSHEFLARCGLSTPRTFTSLEAARAALGVGELLFPLVVKPRWGVSSIGVTMVADLEELELAIRLTRKQLARTLLAEVSATDPKNSILIQECLPGSEFGLDVINNLEGKYVCTLARRKLRMRAGQTDRAMIVHDPSLEKLGRCLGQRLKHIGMLDCDVFVNGHNSHVIDLNPRIGGGYPLSHLAGANFPAALLAWASGDRVDPDWLSVDAGVTVCRCDSFVIHPPREMAMKPRLVSSAAQPGKRLLDLAVSIPALVVLLPILALIALALAFGGGGPVLFCQRRPGLHGELFTVMKFRTMSDDQDEEGRLKPDRDRLTRLGRLLRKTSLDELPQLWNVARGEMSLVGPRPLLLEYLPNYTPQQQRRHNIMPGITGWAQIHGRNGVPFGRRLELDLWYVDHWTLWLDLKILARTVGVVLFSKGVRLEQDLEEVDDVGLHPDTRRKAVNV